jgi:hypothetical protein
MGWFLHITALRGSWLTHCRSNIQQPTNQRGSNLGKVFHPSPLLHFQLLNDTSPFRLLLQPWDIGHGNVAGSLKSASQDFHRHEHIRYQVLTTATANGQGYRQCRIDTSHHLPWTLNGFKDGGPSRFPLSPLAQGLGYLRVHHRVFMAQAGIILSQALDFDQQIFPQRGRDVFGVIT